MTQKKKEKKVGKPNALLYYLLCLILGPLFRLLLGVHYDRTAIREMKGPALIVCPHISNIDFILVALTLFPARPTFVVSEHFMRKPKIKGFLTRMCVIPKKMYCADIRTIMSILRAKAQGHIIVLFPEGRLTCFGHSVNVTEGTAELVKKLQVNVYAITGDGAYLTLPKWTKNGLRRGKIHVRTEKVLDAEQIPALSLAEIDTVLEAAILHDEDHAMTGVTYKSKAIAYGLDGILYKCPACGAEFQTETFADTARGDQLHCRACGATARLDHTYRLHDCRFSTINDWFYWQLETLDLDQPLESEVTVATPGENGYMDLHAGTGHIRLDREAITFHGVVFDRPLSFSEPTSVVKAFPASVSSHFDLYHQKVLYNMHLTPDPKQVIKWVCFLDKLNGNIR